MGVTININGLSLCHESSDGIAMATVPDVCMTQCGPPVVPLPYPNIARSSTLTKGTVSVSVDGGCPAAVMGSEFEESMGDELGSHGGVVSGTTMDKASWLSCSPTVMFESKPACRLSDKMLMNMCNTVCMGGVLQPPCPPAVDVAAEADAVAAQPWKIVSISPAEDVKQFVNIDDLTNFSDCTDDRKRFGPKLMVEVKIDPPLKGQLIWLHIIPDKNNRQVHHIDGSKPLPKSWKASTTGCAYTDDHGIARTKVFAGLYGGDKFKVGAAKKRGASPDITTGNIEVWRKLYFEIVEMEKKDGTGTFGLTGKGVKDFQRAYEKVFIDFEDLNPGKRSTCKHKDYLVIDKSNTLIEDCKWADHHMSPKRSPYKISLIFVDRIVMPVFDSGGNIMKPTTGDTSFGFTEAFLWEVHDGSWHISSRYRPIIKGHKSSWIPLTLSDWNVRENKEPVDSYQVAIDMRSCFSLSADDLNLGLKEFEVELEYQRIDRMGGRYEYRYDKKGAHFHLYIAGEASGVADMASVSIHEVAHALGLVDESFAWHTTDKDHSRHCNDDACTMWWTIEGAKGGRQDFHSAPDPSCASYLRGMVMDRSAMRRCEWEVPPRTHKK